MQTRHQREMLLPEMVMAMAMLDPKMEMALETQMVGSPKMEMGVKRMAMEAITTGMVDKRVETLLVKIGVQVDLLKAIPSSLSNKPKIRNLLHLMAR